VKRPFFYLIVLAIILLDQTFKALINSKMFPGQTIPVLKNFFHLTYVQNTGAAFGILAGKQWFLVLVVMLVILFIMYFHFRLSEFDPLQLPMAFILGGSLGNLIDRLRLFFVVDYLDLRVWPVFNFADVMINLGVLLIVVNVLFRHRRGE